MIPSGGELPNGAAPEGRRAGTTQGPGGARPNGAGPNGAGPNGAGPNGAGPNGRNGGHWPSIEVSIFTIATRRLWMGQ